MRRGRSIRLFWYLVQTLTNYSFTNPNTHENISRPPNLSNFDLPESIPESIPDSISDKVDKSTRNKRVADLSIEELSKRMEDMYGKEYARKHKPVKYRNKLGINSVKYVKRECKEYEDFTKEELASPIFSDFGDEFPQDDEITFI